MRKQRSIKIKLFWCFGTILLAAFGNSVYSLLAIRNMRVQLAREVLGSGTVLDDARQIAIAIANMRSNMRAISLFAVTNHAERLPGLKAAYEQANADARKAVGDMQAQNLTQEEHASVDGIRSRLAQWRENFGQYYDLSASGHGEEASTLTLRVTTPIMDWLQKAAADLGSRSREGQLHGNRAIELVLSRTEALNWLLLVVLLATALGAWWVTDRMLATLKAIGQSFTDGAQAVLSAAAQVSSSSQSLARQSSEQAASLEQTSASSEEINSMARRNSENSQTTAQIAGSSGRRFLELTGALDEMVAGMGQINESSHKISKIIKVIDEIAFQTNILALNAAVEAARAGEAGMGFAVVADEVRNLAHRSAQAAKDTSQLIEESIARSDNGKLKVDQVAESIRSIGAEAGKAKELADEVNLGSQEQLRGIEEISKAIARMEQSTQATAATAEQGSAASQELKAQSASLREAAVKLSEMLAIH